MEIFYFIVGACAVIGTAAIALLIYTTVSLLNLKQRFDALLYQNQESYESIYDAIERNDNSHDRDLENINSSLVHRIDALETEFERVQATTQKASLRG